MKIGWMITDAISVGPPAGAEDDFFVVILDVFWPIQADIVVREPLCDLGRVCKKSSNMPHVEIGPRQQKL